jgi:hypothetical protein
MVSSTAVLIHCPGLNRLGGGWFLRLPGRGSYPAEIEAIQGVEKPDKNAPPGAGFRMLSG